LKYKYISLLILCLLLSACNDFSRTSNLNNEKSTIKRSVPQEIKEANFLFFDATKGSKTLNFYLNENLNKFNIEKVRLFQDDSPVSNYIEVSKEQYKDNKISITLYDYISDFDKIELNLMDGKKATLMSIGQFHLDRIENIDYSLKSEETYSLIDGHSKNQEGQYKAEVTFLKGKADGINMRLPSQFKETDYYKNLKVASESKNKIDYVYELSIPKSYYTENNLENVTIEILWTQTTKNKKEGFIFQEYVPIDI